jgi:hypothetical protein
VCKNLWMAVHGIHSSRLAKVLKIYKEGKNRVCSSDRKKLKTKTYIAKAWMKSSFQKMGDKMPDSIGIHLPCYLDYRILYSYMVEDLTSVEEEIISYSQFCKLMNEDFPDVSIPKVL